MTLLDALLARPPAPMRATAATAAAGGGEEEAVPEEAEGGEEEEEPLPLAWDPSDWWGADDEVVAAVALGGSGSGAAHGHHHHHHEGEEEALSSRRPPPLTGSSAHAHAFPPRRLLPRPWNPEGNANGGGGGYYAQLSADRRTARYVGRGANHAQDVGAVRADRPLPRARDWYYFEVGWSFGGRGVRWFGLVGWMG